MGLLILGLAMLEFAVLLRAWVARRLESQGRPSREAWRTLPYSATVWMGLILIVCAVSPVAAGALVVVVLLTAGASSSGSLRVASAMFRVSVVGFGP